MDILLWTDVTLPMEAVRLALALAGTGIGTYYDVFNNKNVPNLFLYSFLALAVLINIAAYSPLVTAYGLASGLVVFAGTWLLYKAGQLGGADVFILAAVATLLPVQPTLLLLASTSSRMPTLPFILSVFIASGLSFMVYMFARSLPVALSALRKPGSIKADQWGTAVVVLVFYAVVAYVTAQWGLMAPGYFLFLTLVVAATLYFTLFKSALNDSMTESVPVSQIEEEDVLAIDHLDASVVKKYQLSRLVNAAMLKRLHGYREKVPVLKRLPPFIPHLLIGLVLSLLLGNIVVYIAGVPTSFMY